MTLQGMDVVEALDPVVDGKQGWGGRGHGGGQPSNEILFQDHMHGQEEADNDAQFLVDNLDGSKTTWTHHVICTASRRQWTFTPYKLTLSHFSQMICTASHTQWTLTPYNLMLSNFSQMN
jgi:hypothetical protein